MGYEDRDYFRKESNSTFQRPSTGPITRTLLIASGVFYFAVAFAVDDMANAGLTALGDEGFARFMLQSWAFFPTEGFGPAPWQILTAPLIQQTLLGTVIFAGVSIWLIGSQLERLLKPKDYGLLLAAGLILPNIPAALIDPWLSVNPVSMGTGALSMAIFFAAGRIFGKNTTYFGLRVMTIIWVVFAINVVIGAYSYNGAVQAQMGPLLLTPIQSVPALFAGAAVGWFGVDWLLRKGRIAGVGNKQDEEDDHIAYAQQFRVEDDAPQPAATRSRSKQKTGVDKAALQAQEEQERVDQLLERISKDGISSLSAKEKRFLEKISKKKKEGGL